MSRTLGIVGVGLIGGSVGLAARRAGWEVVGVDRPDVLEKAAEILQQTDRMLMTFPEVERVFGKAGRAETSTDPAPFSMMETTVLLKPPAEWRPRERWYTHAAWAPEWFKDLVLRRLEPERLTWDELIEELDRALQIPGTTNAWTMPIKARIDMLSTGVRTPIGVKVYGADLREIESSGKQLEGLLGALPGTRSVFAERVTGGYFIDFDIRREALARYVDVDWQRLCRWAVDYLAEAESGCVAFAGGAGPLGETREHQTAKAYVAPPLPTEGYVLPNGIVLPPGISPDDPDVAMIGGPAAPYEGRPEDDPELAEALLAVQVELAQHAGRGAGLAQEAALEGVPLLLGLSEGGVDGLERHAPAEVGVERAVHHAHGPAPDLALDHVAPQAGPGIERLVLRHNVAILVGSARRGRTACASPIIPAPLPDGGERDPAGARRAA